MVKKGLGRSFRWTVGLYSICSGGRVSNWSSGTQIVCSKSHTISSLRAVLVTAHSRCFRDFGIIGMPRESSTVFILRR